MAPRCPAALPALCTTQIASWGIIYYAFPVLLASNGRHRMVRQCGNGRFSLAVLVSAVVYPSAASSSEEVESPAFAAVNRW